MAEAAKLFGGQHSVMLGRQLADAMKLVEGKHDEWGTIIGEI